MTDFDSLASIDENDIGQWAKTKATSIVETCSYNEADLIHVFAAALTTVRKEARKTAFRDAVQSVKTLSQIGRESLDQRSKRIIKAIKAAANNEEGGGDG